MWTTTLNVSMMTVNKIYLQVQRLQKKCLSWHDVEGTNHGWMLMRLTPLLQQHMPVFGNSDVDWPQVKGWIKPQDTKFICIERDHRVSSQRLTPSLERELHSPFKQMLQVHFLPSLSLHITIIAYKKSVSTSDSAPLLMSSTCCLPRGRALAPCAVIIPPASFSTNANACLAVF